MNRAMPLPAITLSPVVSLLRSTLPPGATCRGAAVNLDHSRPSTSVTASPRATGDRAGTVRSCASVCWPRGAGRSSKPCSTGTLPVVTVVVDRPVGPSTSPPGPASTARVVERDDFGPTFDRVAYTKRVVDALRRGRGRPGGDGRLRHHPRRARVRRLPRPDPEHPPRPAAVVPGLARRGRRPGLRREGHRVHRPRGHPRGGRRADRGPGGRCPSSPTTPSTPSTSASRRSSAASTPTPSPPSSPATWPCPRSPNLNPPEGPDLDVRALLSVYDKTGVVDLAQGLVDLGWELVSSGGTATAIAAAGLPVVEVAAVTGAPEMLGGRVKTLHPKIHGGILADRSNPDHLADLEARDITPIDLVVANLYPFSSDPGIELIDIGGPTMVRAAAKNHAHVGIVVDPSAYGDVLAELRADGAAVRRHPAPPGPGRLRPHRGLRRRHRGLVRRRGRRSPTRCPSTPPPRRRAGPGAALRREPPPGGRPLPAGRASGAGGTTPPSTAARSCRTSTSTTPRPPGAWSTSWATGPPRSSSSTPTPAGRRWPTT